MKYPWEFDYTDFMNRHIRVNVYIDDELKGSFAIEDEDTNMDVETVMPDGRRLVFKKEGHPRTSDQRLTAMELVNYVLTNYKR